MGVYCFEPTLLTSRTDEFTLACFVDFRPWPMIKYKGFNPVVLPATCDLKEPSGIKILGMEISSWIWVVKCRFDFEKPEITCETLKSQSILLRNSGTGVQSLVEFDKNRLVVSLHPKTILLIDNWQLVGNIIDPDPANWDKCWLAPLPDFNFYTFPFVILSGRISYNLLNVRTGEMQVLFNQSGENYHGQEAGFFLKQPNGFSMDFTTKRRNDKGVNEFSWYRFHFRQDLIH